MVSPLQQRSYELTLRVAGISVHAHGGAECARDIHRLLFSAAMDLGAWTERAAGAASRELFRAGLYEINVHVRLVKLWIRLLDDLGAVDPEAACPLHDLAEEIHRLCITALRTARDIVPSNTEMRNGSAAVA